MATYYEVLGVEPTATLEEIRASHRVRLQLVHPDRHQGASEAVLAEAARQTQLLNDAFDVLRDAQSRAAYDRSLADGSAAHAAPTMSAADLVVPAGRRAVTCPTCGYTETAALDQTWVTCHGCRSRYGFVACPKCGTIDPVARAKRVARCSGCGKALRPAWAAR